MGKNWYNEYKKETRNVKKMLKQYPKDSITVIRTKDWYKEYKRELNKAKRRAKRLSKYNFSLDDIELPTTKTQANAIIKKLQKVTAENYKAGKLPDIVKYSFLDTIVNPFGKEITRETIRLTQKEFNKLQKAIERENRVRAERGLEPRTYTAFHDKDYFNKFISNRASLKTVRSMYKEKDQRAVSNLIKSLGAMVGDLNSMTINEETSYRKELIIKFLSKFETLSLSKQIQVLYEFFFDKEIALEVFDSDQSSLTTRGMRHIEDALKFIS